MSRAFFVEDASYITQHGSPGDAWVRPLLCRSTRATPHVSHNANARFCGERFIPILRCPFPTPAAFSARRYVVVPKPSGALPQPPFPSLSSRCRGSCACGAPDVAVLLPQNEQAAPCRFANCQSVDSVCICFFDCHWLLYHRISSRWPLPALPLPPAPAVPPAVVSGLPEAM